MVQPSSFTNPGSRRSIRGAVVAIALAALLLLSGGARLSPVALAAESPRTITIGESNDGAQRLALLRAFDATGADQVKVIGVAETEALLAGIFGRDDPATAYASTLLTCEEPGAGLEIETRYVEAVPPAMYAMALIAAGVDDASLVVAAPADAPDDGVAALAGLFATQGWVPCADPDPDRAGQSLALEELRLTAAIGRALQAAGDDAGLARAAELVLAAHQAALAGRRTGDVDPAAILAAQEEAAGLEVPAPQRDRLIAFLEQVAAADPEGSTLGAGWRIEAADDTRIALRGVADPARERRKAARRAARSAPPASTPTPMPTPTPAPISPPAPPGAGAAASMAAGAWETIAAFAGTVREATDRAAPALQAAATQQAAALQATAAAAPTSTPLPAPTVAPAPFDVTGTIVDAGDGQVTIRQAGRDGVPIAFAVDPAADVTRDGETVRLDAVAEGDAVRMTVDAGRGLVTALAAEPAPVGVTERLPRFWWLVLVPLAAAAAWLARRRSEEPFLVTPRTAPMARLRPAPGRGK